MDVLVCCYSLALMPAAVDSSFFFCQLIYYWLSISLSLYKGFILYIFTLFLLLLYFFIAFRGRKREYKQLTSIILGLLCFYTLNSSSTKYKEEGIRTLLFLLIYQELDDASAAVTIDRNIKEC